MTLKFSKEYWLVSPPRHMKLGYAERRNQRNLDRAKVEADGYAYKDQRFRLEDECEARQAADHLTKATGIAWEVGQAFDASF